MTTRDELIAEARRELGYTERPVNRTKYGKWYGMDGQPWCDMFVSWVATRVRARSIIGKFAYTPAHANWFKARDRYYPGTKGIKRGHIVFFKFPGGPNRIHHVGIVESVRVNGDLVCIEGNTSTANQRDGGSVMRRVRTPANVVGHGRPAYTALKQVYALSRKLYLRPVVRMRGSNVRELQRELDSRGFTGMTINGVFGPSTDLAVRRFQRTRRLNVNGVVDKQTAEALGWKYTG